MARMWVLGIGGENLMKIFEIHNEKLFFPFLTEFFKIKLIKIKK
jgi:hypothetical protein